MLSSVLPGQFTKFSMSLLYVGMAVGVVCISTVV